MGAIPRLVSSNRATKQLLACLLLAATALQASAGESPVPRHRFLIGQELLYEASYRWEVGQTATESTVDKRIIACKGNKSVDAADVEPRCGERGGSDEPGHASSPRFP